MATEKLPEEMTLDELRAALRASPLHQTIAQREKAQRDQWDRERRERDQQIEHELDVKFSAEAGVTIDRWQELKDVFTDWRYEWEKYFS